MPLTIPSETYATLSAMITPALFMTASSSLIISTSNRMSRIVDRIRALNEIDDELDQGKSDVDYKEERRAHVAEQLMHLAWRSDRVRLALTMLYMGLSSFVGTSLVLAIDVLLGSPLTWVPTLLAVIGVTLLFASCVNLTREARRALASNRQEVKFHRDLHALRKADRERRHASAVDTTPTRASGS